MELAKLRYFYAVAKIGHVTRAAEEIHIAQPALTKAIKLLEEELGVPLFYKKGRNVRLTAYGEYLKNKLENILPLLDGIPVELELFKQERRRTVKVNVLAASTVVTDAVMNYKKKHPETVFQLIQNEAETDCDVSVTMRAPDLSALPPFQEQKILLEKIYLAVPKDSHYAQRQTLCLNEMKDEGFVHLAGLRAFRAVCDSFCAHAGFKPRISFESDSPAAVRNIIGAGAGVAFWPEYTWGEISKDMVLLPIDALNCQREIIIGLHTSAFPSTTAQDFYQYLLSFLAKRQQKAQKSKTQGAGTR